MRMLLSLFIIGLAGSMLCEAQNSSDVSQAITGFVANITRNEDVTSALGRNLTSARLLSNPNLSPKKPAGKSPWKYSFDYHLSKSKKFVQEFDFFVARLSPAYQKQARGFKNALKVELHLQFHGFRLTQISFGIKGSLSRPHGPHSHSDSDSSDSDSDSSDSDSDCSDSDSDSDSDSSDSDSEHH